MTENKKSKGKAREKFEDIVQPFLIDQTHLHGRFVRLNKVVTTILNRHNYPTPIARMLAELLVLTAMLGKALKFDGIVTVQLQGDGLVPLMVTDCTGKGELRGHAGLSPEVIEQVNKSDKSRMGVKELFGKGYIAITLDHGLDKERYQGIVELKGKSLTDCFLNYFRASEQFTVYIKTAVSSTGGKNGPRWRAGGMLVQRLPEQGESAQIILPQRNKPEEPPESLQEAWQRTKFYVDTISAGEMLNASLAPRELMYRLFHEDGVWVYEAQKLEVGCRCSRERIGTMLAGMGEDDRQHMQVNGMIDVLCQFCNQNWRFEGKEVDDLANKMSGGSRD